ncbi:MAG: SBBP repeat-containing protein [Candidatus Poseidoniales archaeon]
MTRRRFAIVWQQFLIAVICLMMLPNLSYFQVETQEENGGDSADDLTPAQRHSLEEHPATSHVSGQTDGVATYWAKRAGGAANDYGRSMDFDRDGNVYITGSFQGSADFGSTILNSSSSEDIFVAKLDTNGNWLWAKSAGGQGSHYTSSISVDLVGYVYITGSFNNSGMYFGSTILNSSGDYDIFIAKLNSNGEWLWANRAGGGGSDRGNSIAVNSIGYAYVTGYFSSSSADFGSTTLNSSGGSDVFIAKLNQFGNWLWAKSTGSGNSDIGEDISVDSYGYVYVTGCFFGLSADFGNTTLSGSGSIFSGKLFIGKLDTNGNWLWAKSTDGESTSYGSVLDVDSSGNAYITGSFYGLVDFGSTSLNSPGDYAMYVAKLDTNGNWLWANDVEGAVIDISVDYSGAYLTGSFDGLSVNFGSTTLSSSGYEDIFIAKLDANGNWLWAKSVGGGGYDRGYGIAVDFSGYITVIGTFQGLSADFSSSNILSSAGLTDVFISRLEHDLDGDGILPSADYCANGITNWTSSPISDYDGDGCQDSSEDTDDDGDGVEDEADNCPKGELNWLSDNSSDIDGDGCKDSGEDEDDDGDGLEDEADNCPRGDMDWISALSSADYDSDGCKDEGEDTDDDNDGIIDELDLCPHGALGWTSNKSVDWDVDGCRDEGEDIDDDNDGVLDAIEIEAGSNPLDPNSKPAQSFSVVVGAVELSLWDLMGIIIALLTSGFLAFAFITRGARYDRFSEDISKANEITIPRLENRLEISSFMRLLSPRQSIKLESLLDKRKEVLVTNETVLGSYHDVGEIQMTQHQPSVPSEVGVHEQEP